MNVSRRIAAMAVAAALPGALASCSVAAGPAPGAGAGPGALGPAVTLRVAVYGSPGYRRAGLFAGYERLHPGVRIAEHAAGTQAGYWQAMRRQLAAGRVPADLVAIPMAEMSGVLRRYPASLVPLSTLGGVAGGLGTFTGQSSGHRGSGGRRTGPARTSRTPTSLRCT